MKTQFIKCDYCKIDICDDAGKCALAVHKRVIDGKEYLFCCENHANRFEKENRKSRKNQ